MYILKLGRQDIKRGSVFILQPPLPFVRALARVAACRESERGLKKRHTTSGEYTLLDGRVHRIEHVAVAVLLLTDLNLSATADLDDCDTAAELRNTLLELRLVVFACANVVEH